jgi:hypothetical protein
VSLIIPWAAMRIEAGFLTRPKAAKPTENSLKT